MKGEAVGGRLVGGDACPSCGGFAWSCARCGHAAGFDQVGTIGRSARRSVNNGRALTEDEFSALMARCLWMRNAAGVRDAAVIALLCAGGLNRFEVAALELSDLEGDAAAVWVRGEKGSASRRVILEGLAAQTLMSWVASRGRRPGSLFLKMDTMGREILDKGFSAPNITEIVRRRATEAGIGPLKVADLHNTALTALFGERHGREPSEAGSQALRRVLPHPDRFFLSAAARMLAGPWTSTAPVSEIFEGLTTEELERLKQRANAMVLSRRVADVRRRGPKTYSAASVEETRRLIARAAQDGIPRNELARLIGISETTVRRYVEDSKQGQLLAPRGPTIPGNRERKIGAQARQALEADLEARPFSTIWRRVEHLEALFGIGVSDSLVRREIHELGFRYVRQPGFGADRGAGRWVRREPGA